ncbi:MAG: Asp-tRNA(Asn)/Glu-tRNA(Gln) amidotransferase subunit GatB [Candidatus Yanofskybacteria bacterium]|nr:Asp-tRNA(Asn)/Glu-tRNA(Gln) amidotransferase subunit GatB [Candidatus Yanofskybacteria bacterium]
MSVNYKPVIGLEIHAELNTKTKMFCDSLNDPDEKHPNINICPVCLGHPGTLPVTNIEAVKKVILAGLALNCTVAKDTFFERKNYFYPDLPKGYQISQYQKPLCENGHLDIDGKRIKITRIHLEEDAGRLYHLPGKDYSLVDFNRAGVPLMELVTEPDFENGQEVRKFAEELQLIWKYLGVSDADMEKGQMRVEVNISLTGNDGKWGTKVEIKNLNSIKFAADAVDYEIKRQAELLDKGGKIIQETRGWDENKKSTFSQRSKEEAHDYRYFPEPDLPPLKFTDEQIDMIGRGMPELPSGRRIRFARYGLTTAQIQIFTVFQHLGDYYERVASELDSAAMDYHKKKGLKGDFTDEPQVSGKLHTLAANYMITELPPLLGEMTRELDEDINEINISAEAFAELMVLIFHKELSSTGAKAVLKEMAESGLHPEQIVKEKDLGQMSDAGMLESTVDETIEENQQAVEDYKKGKEASMKFLIGKVMAKTKGKANPEVVAEMLNKKLK